uniref:Uncharacterized protein n=1 Tax=Brassica oleracea TaxID=3712 RepID=A0A3P6BKS8_BRAOL|nr:unnamed protein product [Brassica oleracea]
MKTSTMPSSKCPPALHVWVLASTPTPPLMFTKASQYTNTDYLFWQKNDIKDPELDKDPYQGYTGIHRKLSYTLSQNGLLGLNKDPFIGTCTTLGVLFRFGSPDHLNFE